MASGLERLLHNRRRVRLRFSDPIGSPASNNSWRSIFGTRRFPAPPGRLVSREGAGSGGGHVVSPAAGDELFCRRQKRLNHEARAKGHRRPQRKHSRAAALEELGRQVGCSHFYLSRTFTSEMGRTISQYLRELRMERAAAFAARKQLNVLQVALEVGYSSRAISAPLFTRRSGVVPGFIRWPLLPTGANESVCNDVKQRCSLRHEHAQATAGGAAIHR